MASSSSNSGNATTSNAAEAEFERMFKPIAATLPELPRVHRSVEEGSSDGAKGFAANSEDGFPSNGGVLGAHVRGADSISKFMTQSTFAKSGLAKQGVQIVIQHSPQVDKWLSVEMRSVTLLFVVPTHNSVASFTRR